MTQFTSTSTQANDQVNNKSNFLQIDNLFKSYKNGDGSESSILENINLSIEEDEFISVIGH